MKDIIDRDSKFIKDYLIAGNTIILQKQSWFQLLLWHTIDRYRIFSFKFKIAKTTSSDIMIGVIDKRRMKEKSSYSTEHALAYYGRPVNNIWPDRETQGTGFHQGDIV